MAAIDFPSSPTPGQEFTAAGRTWIWNDTTDVWESMPQDEFPPSPHATTHADGGTDEIEIAPTQITASATSGQVLSSDGTTTVWSDPAGGLPTQTGNAGELLVTNGTAASWSNTVIANSASVPALIAKGTTSQSTNFFEIQSSTANVLARFNQFGNFVVGNTSTGELRLNGQTGTMTATSQTPATVTVDITAAPSQSANIQNWRDSSNTVLASIGSTGLLTANPATPASANAAKAVGYVGMPVVAGSFISVNNTHAGKMLYLQGASKGVEFATDLEIGTTVVIYNGEATGNATFSTAGSQSYEVVGQGVIAGTRTIAPWGMVTAIKIASGKWVLSGNGLS